MALGSLVLRSNPGNDNVLIVLIPERVTLQLRVLVAL